MPEKEVIQEPVREDILGQVSSWSLLFHFPKFNGAMSYM